MAEKKQPRRWIEFALEEYPAVSPVGTTYRWATRPYPGSVFIEGRVTVDGWQSIDRAASAMSGEYHIDSASVLINDTDGLVRSLLDGVTTQWFLNREAAFHLLSEAAFNAGLEPRLLFGGRCFDVQIQNSRRAQLEFEDILAPYLEKTYPQYTLGDAYPYRFTDEEQDDVDEFLATDDPGLKIPIALRDQRMPIYYGPFIDTALDPISGLPRQKGMLPTFFMGYTFLTAGTGEVGFPTPEVATILDTFYEGVLGGWGGWGEMFVCLGEMDIPNVYGSNLAATNPQRTNLSEHYGTSILAPGHPFWPFATDYVMRNGFRCTVIYVRGPVLWQHLMGIVNVTVDGCGWKDSTSPGTPIDQAAFVYQDFITQHVLAHDGAGFTSGPTVGLPTFADGRAMFWTSKVQALQAMWAERLGTDKGYLCSIALTEPTTLRDILRTWHVTFDAFSAKNAAGQLYPFAIDDLADPSDGVAIRERIELTNLPAPRIAWEEIENEMDYTVGWDPEQQTPRTTTLTIRDQASIDALKGDVRKKSPRDLRYTADDATATDVSGRRLMRLRQPPRYQPLPVRTGGVDREIGEQVRISHRDGFGAPGVGYSERAMVLFGHKHVGNTITLSALDVEGTLSAAARFAADDVPNWADASDAERLLYGFWTEDDGTIPPDGLRGSEWR